MGPRQGGPLEEITGREQEEGGLPRRIHERRDSGDGDGSDRQDDDGKDTSSTKASTMSVMVDIPPAFKSPPYTATAMTLTGSTLPTTSTTPSSTLPTTSTTPSSTLPTTSTTQTPAAAIGPSSSSNTTTTSQSTTGVITGVISASPLQTSGPQPRIGVEPPVSPSSITQSPATTKLAPSNLPLTQAQKLLIAVGSIGSFVLMCLLIWVIWRAVKRSRKGRSHVDNGGRLGVLRRVIPEHLAARVAFLQARVWQNLGGSGPAGAPPSRYSGKGAPGAAEEPLGGFYSQEKTQVAQQRVVGGAEGPVLILSRANSFNLGTLTGVQDGPVTGSPISEIGPQQIARLSPTEAAQYATVSSVEAMGTLDPEGTMRSRMGPGMFFNQSELARQPSDASELSSLSSGFGDGDMMLPDGVAVVLNRPLPVAASPCQPNHLTPRFSWMRTAGGNRNSRDSSSSSSNGGRGGGSGSGRDTVYTEASDDTVPRFRSINSWVNQQTSRVKPALPGVHSPPSA